MVLDRRAADAGERDGGGRRGGLRPGRDRTRIQRAGEVRRPLHGGPGGLLTQHLGGLLAASQAPAQEGRQRQERGDARGDGRTAEQVEVGAREVRVAPAGLAVREVARDAALIAQAGRALTAVVDDRLHAQAALAADELLVLLAQSLASAKQRALHGRPAHPEAIADLPVRQPFELAHDEDLVMHGREPAEGAAQVVEGHLALDGGVGRRAGRRQAPLVGGADLVVGVEGDLGRVAPAPVGVDALVLGDLVDPRPEEDLALVAGAQTPQRRHENLLGDVLGASVIAHHPADIRRDPGLIAQEERLERAIVAGAHRGDEVEVVQLSIVRAGGDSQGRHDLPIPPVELMPARTGFRARAPPTAAQL